MINQDKSLFASPPVYVGVDMATEPSKIVILGTQNQVGLYKTLFGDSVDYVVLPDKIDVDI